MGGPPHYEQALRKLAPKGIDLFFDTVGGDLSEGVFRILNDGAKVAICGNMTNCCARNMGAAMLGPLWTRRGLIFGTWHLLTNFKDAMANLAFAHTVRVNAGATRGCVTVTSTLESVERSTVSEKKKAVTRATRP